MFDNKIKKKLIVVADDFTGANDVGVQFRKVGLKVNVIISTEKLKEDLELTDVLVVDLESRFDHKDLAYQKCYDLGQQLYEIGNTIVYKKIDSTLRGNLGTEIDGLMDALHLKLAVMAPGLPSSGRTTVNGEVYVHHVKLASTEFALDPRTPVKHSRIADIIALQSKRTTTEITAAAIRDEHSMFSKQIAGEINAASKILIFDVEEETDLLQIAQHVEDISEHPILVIGSAGLANHISNNSYKKKKVGFVFSGSVSEQTRKQIRHAEAVGAAKVFLIKAEDLMGDDFDAGELTTTIATDLENGTNRFIFTSALTREDVDKVFSLAKEKGRSNEDAAEHVALALGRLAGILINKFNPAGVLLTGGDTAIKTVRALKGTGFTIDSEIVPGIPAGMITGSAFKTMIATKSGGFGADDAILKTLEFFES